MHIIMNASAKVQLLKGLYIGIRQHSLSSELITVLLYALLKVMSLVSFSNSLKVVTC